jgi:hypothetical protein
VKPADISGIKRGNIGKKINELAMNSKKKNIKRSVYKNNRI